MSPVTVGFPWEDRVLAPRLGTKLIQLCSPTNHKLCTVKIYSGQYKGFPHRYSLAYVIFKLQHILCEVKTFNEQCMGTPCRSSLAYLCPLQTPTLVDYTQTYSSHKQKVTGPIPGGGKRNSPL